MNSDQQDLVAQFCGVTGANASSAQTALASANWNLQEAVALYYAAQEGSEDQEEEEEDENEPTAAAQSASSQPPAASSSSTRRPPPNQSRLRTLRDLQSSAQDEDEDDEKDRDLFAGGEKSGLAVQNPGSGGPVDHFRNILGQARQNRDRPPPSQQPVEEEPQRHNHFTGRAQTLGGDEEPSRVIDDAASSAGGRRAAQPERIARTMHLWADGVSIDDGPLFRFDDPNNAHIMAQINRGQAPLSLLDVQPDQEVDLTLEPHKDENYVQPKKTYKPFSGQGQRLGSPTPGPNPSSSTATPQTQTQAPAASSGTTASATQSIDESAPTLTLQIRLGDGTRLTSRFNTTHTIGDVYDFVNRASAQSTQRAYALMTTFPSKELEDQSQVLGDISDFKRGGVVVQKWK